MSIYPKVVLVGQSDIDYLRSMANSPVSSLALYTNGVTCLPKISFSYDSMKICFVGNMRTLQNQDAVIRFVNNIFPIIKKSIPGAKFYIVGAEPSQRILNLDDGKNVVVTGFVEDLYSFIKDSCIAVAPVAVAAGIQNKVLVAMGCGLPVIMSSLISHAIPQLNNGDNCFVCDDDEIFASRCIELMEKSELRNRIASAGYEMVKACYSWEEKLNGYEYLD